MGLYPLFILHRPIQIGAASEIFLYRSRSAERSTELTPRAHDEAFRLRYVLQAYESPAGLEETGVIHGTNLCHSSRMGRFWRI